MTPYEKTTSEIGNEIKNIVGSELISDSLSHSPSDSPPFQSQALDSTSKEKNGESHFQSPRSRFRQETPPSQRNSGESGVSCLQRQEISKQTRLTERDLTLLSWVCDQGAMTVNQIWKAVFQGKKSTAIKYGFHRVHALEKEGFLKSMRTPVMRERFLIGTPLTGEALWHHVKSSVRLHAPPITELIHTHMLTELRILIQASGKCQEWRSERPLLHGNFLPPERFREHVPDALWINRTGTRIFIEYERARKNGPRLRRKVEAYDREMSRVDRVMDHVLWIGEAARVPELKRAIGTKSNHTVRTLTQLQEELT